MWTRTKTFANVTITATFSHDAGDPSVGIEPGWGEDTGVEIVAPLASYVVAHDKRAVRTAFVTWITFRDFTIAAGVRASTTSHLPIADPADWIVENVETAYRDTRGHTLTLAEDQYRRENFERIVRLSQLPEVLEVVRDAYENMQAAERLSVAQEGVQMLEVEIGELEYALAEPYERWAPGHHAEGKATLKARRRELELAKVELAEATKHAQERGVT